MTTWMEKPSFGASGTRGGGGVGGSMVSSMKTPPSGMESGSPDRAPETVQPGPATVAVAAALVFQLLEMKDYNLFQTLQARFF